MAILKSIDVLVLPSYREGTPNVIMEAMACGRCIVATAVGGTPELLQDGVHGRLIPARDSKALADALIEVLEDAELRNRLAAAARARIRDFNYETMIERYEELLAAMAKAGRADPH